jgi:hypothetical protein
MNTKELPEDYIDLSEVYTRRAEKPMSDVVREVIKRFYGQSFTVYQLAAIMKDNDKRFEVHRDPMQYLKSFLYLELRNNRITKVSDGHKNGSPAYWRKE